MHSRFGSRGATPLLLPRVHNCHNPKHQVQQNQKPSLRLVTDSLDIVAIGIEKERAVGVGVVVRAKPRRPIVRSSSSKAGAMTCVHFGAQCSGKCNMDRPGRTSAIAYPKERFGCQRPSVPPLPPSKARMGARKSSVHRKFGPVENGYHDSYVVEPFVPLFANLTTRWFFPNPK